MSRPFLMHLPLIRKLSLGGGPKNEAGPGSSRNTRKESVQTCLNPGEEDNFPPDLRVEGNMKKSGKPGCKG